MRRKGLFSVFMMVFLVAALAGTAFAAQNVALKTTVPEIPKSDCYQAGAQTMEFDNLTRLTNGDVIRFSLSNNTSICKDFRFYLRLHDGTAVTDLKLLTSTSADPVTATTPANALLTLGGTFTSNGTVDYGFVVQGSAGSQFYTATLAARTIGVNAGVVSTTAGNTWWITFTEGATPGNKLIVKLFDKKFLTPYFWKYGLTAAMALASTPASYILDSAGTGGAAATGYTAMVADDNVLCVNTGAAAFTGEYLLSTPNSIPNVTAPAAGVPLVFSGDYTIAHVIGAQTVSQYTCKGANAGRLIYPGTQVTCAAFDFEGAIAGSQYCASGGDLHSASQVIFFSTAPWEQTNYRITADILVNGVLGTRGVYFSNTNVGALATTTSTAVCNAAATTFPGQLFYLSTGGAAITPAAAQVSCNPVAATQKATRFVTTSSNLGITDTLRYYLYVDLPPFVWNLAEVSTGAVVSVRILLEKVTCGTVATYDWTIGTFGCTGGTGTGAGTCLYPYFTSLAADPTYWNGIAIVNTSSTAGTATLTATEQDGSVGTFTTPSIAAGSMFVSLLENIAWTGAGLGGSPVWISAAGSTFTPAGFAMIANPANGASMGYLCK